MKYKTVSEIFADFHTIPADIREKYSNLSFGNMADMPECEPYAPMLLDMERDWKIADSSFLPSPLK